MSRYKGRTVRALNFRGDIWPIVASWAQSTGYKLVGGDYNSQTWQRGLGALVAPQMVKVSWDGSRYVLEAWVRINILNRIFALGLLPSELIIDSGGLLAIVPRNKARDQVNQLLAMLGEPPII